MRIVLYIFFVTLTLVSHHTGAHNVTQLKTHTFANNLASGIRKTAKVITGKDSNEDSNPAHVIIICASCIEKYHRDYESACRRVCGAITREINDEDFVDNFARDDYSKTRNCSICLSNSIKHMTDTSSCSNSCRLEDLKRILNNVINKGAKYDDSDVDEDRHFILD